MQIAHISTGDKGGAYLASRRLQVAQAEFNSSHMWNSKRTLEIGKLSNRISYVLKSKFSTLFFKLITRQPFGIISPVSVASDIPSQIKDHSSTVLHIHNWFNVLSISQLREAVTVFPTVFTLHDQRMLTGGCHYTFGCEGYKTTCQSCPAARVGKNLVMQSHRQLSKFFEDAANHGTQFICPSKWLYDQFKEMHPDLSDSLHLIPNVIQPDFFQVSNQFPEKNIYNLLFVADVPSKAVKGLDLLMTAISKLPIRHKERIKLLVVGEKSNRLTADFQVEQLGYLNSTELSNVMDICGVNIVPSRIDNSPSIIVESQLKNLFVIGTRVGGIPSLITHKQTGLLSDPTVDSIMHTLLNYFDLHDFEKEKILKNAHAARLKTHSTMMVLKKHHQVYRDAIKGFK